MKKRVEMNKASKIALKYCLMIGLIVGIFVVLMNSSFVFAEHVVKFNNGIGFITINQSSSTAINFTVNVSDLGVDANVSVVNVTIPSSFAFIASTNGYLIFDKNNTNVSATFSNTTTLLNWQNTTYYLVNGSNMSYFWFNVSASATGNYTINITSVNGTGTDALTVQNSSFIIYVNDTTVPTINYTNPTPANASNISQNYLYINVSVNESFEDTIRFNLYYVNGTSVISYSYTNATRAVYFNDLADGNYSVNVTINDTYGSSNTSEYREFYIDTTGATLNVISPVNLSVYNATIVNLTIAGNENLDFCKFSHNDWITNLSMKRLNSTAFYNDSWTFYNGTKTVNFWCNDSAGNSNVPMAVVFDVRNWQLSGYTYDINGTGRYNATINVTIRDSSFNIVGYNSTYSNASGWFNLTVAGNPNWMYEPNVIHFVNNVTDSSTSIDGIGQSMPAFPYAEMASGLDINFYLRDAGTINITVINGTLGDFRSFQYQVKDQATGFSIKESWSQVTGAIIYVPRDRNYSIMIYPNDSMPLSYNWNNFTSSNSYNIGALSTYNASNYTLHKQFNTTMALVKVNGTMFNSSNGLSSSWDEFKVVPFLMEAGNMIYLGAYSMTFTNMSAWVAGGNSSDFFNNNNGFYNITIPGPHEGANFMLFATARNATGYYGGYRNVSVSYTTATTELNFTMYPLMSTDWGSTNSNITVKNPTTWASLGINTSKQAFNIVNSSNSTYNNIEASVELTLDYTNYNATKFTFMTNIGQGSNSSFYFPLINSTGVEEVNIYSMSGAPKRVGKKTATQVLNGANNFTLSAFNPGAIDGSLGSGAISVSIYRSNSTCDVPVPPTSCVLTASSTMATFNPLGAIMGGGAISFRMGATASDIEVHYVNVDMLASGPPDALFDSSATTSTSGTFDTAMRFGSGGPTTYDYVLISMPYTEGSTSVAGLNESNSVNMSIPTFYDEDWNVVWNSTINGTNGTALAGNYSHYNTYSSQWETLMSPSNCTTNSSLLNATNPCYIDIINNKIWIRLPHFSGTQPNIDGAVTTVTAAAAAAATTSSGSSGGSIAYWRITSIVSDDDFKKGYTKELSSRERMRVNVNDEIHYVGIISVGVSSAVVNVSSVNQQATLNVGELKMFDVNDDSVYDLSVKLESISDSKVSLTIKAISEKVVGGEIVNAEENREAVLSPEEIDESISEGKSLVWLWIIIVLVIVVGVVVYYFIRNKK